MVISLRASASGLPCSAVISLARSSRLSRISSIQRRSSRVRSLAGRPAQAGKAASAAAMARRVSAAAICGAVPIEAPSAGLVTVKVSPDSASSQAAVHVSLPAK